MSDGSQYDGDYFIRGKQTGKSLYENYSWKPELTIPMVQAIINHCGMKKSDGILDFGCARGYLVKALRGLGYDGYGFDVSEWALSNADEEVKEYLTLCGVSQRMKDFEFDWIIAKDVLEHIEYVHHTIDELMAVATKGIFIVVPLSKFDKGRYVVEDYERDITHCQRWTLATWVRMLVRPGWSVEASYRLVGVKDNYYTPEWSMGNGFITCRTINED